MKIPEAIEKNKHVWDEKEKEIDRLNDECL